MRENLHATFNLSLFLLLLIVSTQQCCSQSDYSPQNIEVFYNPSSSSASPPPPEILPSPPAPPDTSSREGIVPPPLVPQSKSSTKSAVGRAIGITAASTFVLCGLLLFVLLAYSRRRKREAENGASSGAAIAPPHVGGNNPANGSFVRFEGNIKGLIVDENGLDVLYWKNLQEGEGDRISSFKRRSYRNLKDDERREEEEKRVVSSTPPVQEVPLLRGMSSTSQSPVWAVENEDDVVEKAPPSFAYGEASFKVEGGNVNPPLPPPPARRFEAARNGRVVTPPPPPQQLGTTVLNPQPSTVGSQPPQQQFAAVPKDKFVDSQPSIDSRAPLKKPPQQFESAPKGKIDNPQPSNERPPPSGPPPRPPPSPAQQFEAASKGRVVTPAPPPPPPNRRDSPPAPPPPSGGSSAAQPSSSSSGTNEERAKLKPLHWDKVNPNANHSMVWDKIDNGSFKFDGDLMEALFGYVATNRKSPRGDGESTSPADNGPQSQIFILETRKSQNTAIVLKSLGLSRKEIIEALTEGRGLNPDAIEKLARISPTEEEQSQILAFNGDPTRLADAESFVYHILKAVPSAFTRFNAMLFRSNYEADVSNIRESLKTLESGCEELRTRGLFLKLLEAVLKAGNRLNAGTSRGNAQAFNLNALRKLSDVKSTDRKTTLLQFVVQEVVRAEGKRCVLNRNRSLSSQSSDSDNSFTAKDDQEREYMKLGLPVIGGLSTEFSNVKKAATLDHDVLLQACSVLEQQVIETRRMVAQCGDEEKGGFVAEMRGFLDAAESEAKVLKDERGRVMELVKKTTDYYQQTGASKEKNANLLQLFVIVRDFLEMVDQVCIEISRDVQKRKSGSSSLADSSSPRVFRFPKLPPNFMSDEYSKSDSSEHDDESSAEKT